MTSIVFGCGGRYWLRYMPEHVNVIFAEVSCVKVLNRFVVVTEAGRRIVKKLNPVSMACSGQESRNSLLCKH